MHRCFSSGKPLTFVQQKCFRHASHFVRPDIERMYTQEFIVNKVNNLYISLRTFLGDPGRCFRDVAGKHRVRCCCLDLCYVPSSFPRCCFCTISVAIHTIKKANNILELLWKYSRPCKLPEGSWRPQGSVDHICIATGIDSIIVTLY